MIETIRDNKLVWPYCSECGCRLSVSSVGQMIENYKIEHFYGYPGTDANGCKCGYIGHIRHVSDPRMRVFV